MARSALLLACGWLLCWGTLGSIAQAVPGEAAGRDAATSVDLKEQLEKGLKARRPAEFQFIGRVVERVNEGVLPRGLVQSCFQWARKKPARKVQYFQQCLKFRAKKLGIRV